MSKIQPKKKPIAKTKAGTSKGAAADRRKVFVEAYITNGGNATDAAKTAGFSHKTAGSQGQRLLKDVEIQATISMRAKDTAKKYELSTEMVVRSIVQEIHFDPAKLYNEDGTLKNITELDEDVRMALTSVEFEQIGSPDAPIYVRKIKWAGKHQAREQAMKHLGMFENDNKQRGLGMLSELPRDMLKSIVEKLQQSNGKL